MTLAILVCLSWSDRAIGQPASEQMPPNNRESYQRTVGSNLSATEAIAIERSPTYSIEYGIICSDPKDHQDADLCQQWRSAQAAEKSAIVGQQQFIATLVEGGLLGLSLIFTAWAAIAAGRAAKAADRSVQITERTSRTELRAYLFPDGSQIVERDIPIKIMMQIKNSGQTPAYKVVFRAKGKVMQKGKEDFDLKDAKPSMIGVIGPNLVHRIECTFVVDFSKLEDQDGVHSHAGLFFFGDINYLDIFGNSQSTTFKFIENQDSTRRNETLIALENGMDGT